MRNPFRRKQEERSLSIDEWIQYFNYGGLSYPFIPSQTLGHKQEEPDTTFAGYVQGIYKTNGVVFACMTARQQLFSEASFQFVQIRNGKPGDLFGTSALGILEQPWQNGTTGDLLAQALLDVDLAGNFYAVKLGQRLMRLSPDWVTIILGSKQEPDFPRGMLDMEVAGYLYKPGGPTSPVDPVALRPELVAHFAPIPDPVAMYRGMSWLTPVIREIMGDSSITTHKLHFFEGGGTPNLAVSLQPDITPEQFERWVSIFESKNPEVVNAYKTLYLGGGADINVIGTNIRQAAIKETQGAGETRICAAARVPPIIVGVSEGLAASTYSNYGQARRHFADGTLRPLWRKFANSLEHLVQVPSGSRLWYDDRHIPFLQEDLKDGAEVQESKARQIKALVEAGFEPQSVIDAVNSDDFSRLKDTGLRSVQLQPPGSQGPAQNGGSPAANKEETQ